MPGWMIGIVSRIGGSKLAILNFAVAAVAAHRRRRRRQLLPAELPDHQRRPADHARPAAHGVSPHPSPVARRPRREANRRPDQPRDERHRQHPGLRHLGDAGHRRQHPHAAGHRRDHALRELALHADLAGDRAGALPRRLFLHAADQERLARGPEDGERADLDRPGGLLVDSRGEGVCPRGLRAATVRAAEPGQRRDGPAGARHEDDCSRPSWTSSWRRGPA